MSWFELVVNHNTTALKDQAQILDIKQKSDDLTPAMSNLVKGPSQYPLASSISDNAMLFSIR